MADIKPFAALIPKPDLADQICELPYDVMSSDEAREMAKDKPLSFLHVSKPEIDLPPETDPYSDAVYAKGAENLQKLIADGHLFRDQKPNFYFYRQIMGDHSQIGLVAAASCEEYLSNTIRKHEFTRPQKEDDRVRHIESLNSQTGPVFLTYRASSVIDAIASEVTSKEPVVDFTGEDGVRHTSWTVSDESTIATIADEFAQIPNLYIADGHHRSAAAGRVFQSRNGAGATPGFLTVIFPDHQMKILAYNRAVKTLNGLSPSQLLDKIDLVATLVASAEPVEPASKHEFGMYLAGQWYRLQFREHLLQSDDPVEMLDVALLQNNVLSPLLGIDDPRTSPGIDFVGGIRGLGELERLVNQGSHQVAFSMYATSIDDLMSVADADKVMPPKSTWFEPKLRDAMFSYMLD